MNSKISLNVIGLSAMLMLIGCSQHEVKYTKVQPAKLEKREGEKNPFLILTPEAEKRLGIQVNGIGKVLAIRGKKTFQVPLSSILYDERGRNWIYFRQSESSNSPIFHRVEVELVHVDDKVAYIDASRNTQILTKFSIVSVGAAELLGTESGVGK